MDTSLLPQVIAGAVVLAGIYVLVGLSWVIVFRAARLMNFATGQLLVLAAYLAATFANRGFGYGGAIVLTLAIMTVIGMFMYRFLLRPFAGRPLFTPVIVTFGFSIIVEGVIQIAWGANEMQITPPFSNSVHHFFGSVTLTTYDLIVPAVALVVYIALLLFFRFTRLGGQMRAANESPLLASQSGMNVYLLYGLGFALSVFALGAAGIANAERTIVSTGAIPLGLAALVPAMLGGIDSIGGVLVGALFVAIAQNLAILYLGANYSNLVVFSILLLVLAVRPYGLFGSPEVQRV